VKALGYLKMIISVTSFEFYSLGSYDHLSALLGCEECWRDRRYIQLGTWKAMQLR